MKNSFYSVMWLTLLVFSFVGVCKAQETRTFVGDNWGEIKDEAPSHFYWEAAYTFTQTLKAKADGNLSLLWVHMGNNQRSYSARLVIKINDVEVFNKVFNNLKQNFYELPGFADVAAPTEFVLEGINQKVKIGDKIELQITPRGEKISMAPVLKTSDDFSSNKLEPYGNVALRFRLR